MEETLLQLSFSCILDNAFNIVKGHHKRAMTFDVFPCNKLMLSHVSVNTEQFRASN